MNPDERLEELMIQAEELDNTPAKVAILEEAVREADALGDIDQAFYVRQELVRAATFSGYKEKAMVAFTWCLGQFDKDPDRFGDFDLLWQYKWVLGSITDFPQISREQIVRMQDDFESRLQTQGYGLRASHYLRFDNFKDMGDMEVADDYFKKWRAAPNDMMADCRACEQNRMVDMHIAMRRDEQALKQAEPILQGRLSCAEIPHATYSKVLLPLMRLGRFEEARECYQKGYRMISRNQEFLLEAAEHLLFLVRDGELAKGARLLEKHLGWALASTALYRRLHFYLAAEALLLKLARKGRPRKLRLPRELPCHRDDDTYQPAELAAWFTMQANELLERFDRRNGNDSKTRWAQELRELAAQDHPQAA